MNWITELGQTILNKMGLSHDQPTATQKAVLEAVKKTEIEVELHDEDPAARIEFAAETYHFLENTSAAGTSVEWKRETLRTRMLAKFPGMAMAKVNEIVESLYA